MRLRSDQLKKFAQDSGAGVEVLADAVRPLGLPGEAAERAVRNWLAGRPKPSCKAPHIRALARVVNAEPRDIARFVSEVRHHRGSTQKARLVADLIRGKSVDEALNLLNFSTKRASVNLAKALNAAIADAELADADVTELVVVESRVDEAQQIKRFRPKDRGRAHPIIKQTSHITVGVQERA